MCNKGVGISAARPYFDVLRFVIVAACMSDIVCFGIRQVAKAVLSGAKAGSLVLMDEMGSGTDPMQGAALAQSLLEARRLVLSALPHYTRLVHKAIAIDSNESHYYRKKFSSYSWLGS